MHASSPRLQGYHRVLVASHPEYARYALVRQFSNKVSFDYVLDVIGALVHQLGMNAGPGVIMRPGLLEFLCCIRSFCCNKAIVSIFTGFC
jgi:hypothetical protein